MHSFQFICSTIWGNCLSGGNYFWGKFYDEGAIFRGATILGGNCLGENFLEGNYPRGQWSGGQLSGGQFSSGAIVLEPNPSHRALKVAFCLDKRSTMNLILSKLINLCNKGSSSNFVSNIKRILANYLTTIPPEIIRKIVAFRCF